MEALAFKKQLYLSLLMAKKTVNEKIKKETTEQASFFTRYRYEAIVFFVCFLLFANSIPNDYNMDDELVTKNHRLSSKGISAIPEIFASPYYKDDMGYIYEYRPVVLASFAIEHQLFGDNPHTSHFFNLLLYALCCVLLFRVLSLVLSSVAPIILFGITLLFVAHPAHTEVVCSIKNRDEIFALMFALLSLLIAYKAVTSKQVLLYLLLPVFFMLSLLSKLSGMAFAIIIPVAIILFTEASFKKVMLIVFLLAIPSFFVINMGALYPKILVELFLIAAVAVFYGVYHIQQLWQPLLWTIKSSYVTDNSPPENKSDKNITGNVTDLLVAFMFLAVVVFLGGIFFKHHALVLVAAIALLFIVFYKNERISWWANVLLYGCLSLAYLNYKVPTEINPWTYPFYINLLLIILVYQIFWGDRKLLIPSLICFAIVSVKSALIGKPIMIPEAAFVALCAGRRWKIIWPAIGFFFWIMITDIFSTLTESNFSFIEGAKFGSPLALLLVVILLLNRGAKQVVWGYKLGVIVLLFGFLVSERNNRPEIESSYNVRAKVDDFGEKVNTNVQSFKQDRPIQFVEQPLKSSDPWQLRAGTSLEILFQYLHKVVLPYPMAFYYGYKFISPERIMSPIPLMSFIVHLILGCIALAFLHKHKMIAFSLIIYLVSIAAVSSYVMSLPGQMGERFLLIPSLGWCMLIVFIFFKLFKGTGHSEKMTVFNLPKGIKYSFTTLFCLYSAMTFSRNFDWKNDIVLFRHDIKYVNNSAQAHNLLALHLMQHSEKEPGAAEQTALKQEALLHFKKALEIYPPFFNVAHDIGRVYTSLSLPDSAILAFKQALTIDTSVSDVHRYIGELYFSQGKLNDAIPYYEHLINVLPTEADSYNKLSFIYYQLKQYDQSIAVNKKGIRLVPNFIDAYINIGQTYISMNMSDSATYFLTQAIQINPDNQTARQLLQSISK